MKRKSETTTPGKPEPRIEDTEFKVEDKRHWTRDLDADETEIPPAKPTIIDEYRERAERAEQKLLEYIEAFKQFRSEQEQVRVRLTQDVQRKVELQFGEVVAELLSSIDDLDLALAHVSDAEAGGSLARGVRIVRDKFLETIERHGVERVDPTGEAFDPNQAQAIRVDPVDDPGRKGTVTETLRPGYRLGERVIRVAQVAVGESK